MLRRLTDICAPTAVERTPSTRFYFSYRLLSLLLTFQFRPRIFLGGILLISEAVSLSFTYISVLKLGENRQFKIMELSK